MFKRKLLVTVIALFFVTPCIAADITSFTIDTLEMQVKASTASGLATSLTSILEAAKVAYARGQSETTKTILKAFQRATTAQSGVRLSASLASFFIDYSNRLINALDNNWHLGDVIVGPEGATIQVVDPNSPIVGTILEIPAQALSTSTAIILTHTDTVAPLPPTTNVAGPVVELQPEGLVLNAVAKLMLPYPDADQNGLIDGAEIAETLLQVRRYDGAMMGLLLVPAVVDPINNFAVASIEHFSSYRWFNAKHPVGATITYNFDDLPPQRDGSLTDEQVKEAVRRAMRTWESILQPVGIRFEERSPLIFTDLEIFWGSLTFESTVTGSAVVAETSWDWTSFIPNFQQEIKFNELLKWTAATGINLEVFNIEAVALHELGHVLGLGDLAGSQPPIMAGNRNAGLPPPLILYPEDITAIRELYGIPICTLTATPPIIVNGLSTTLSWITATATSATIDPGIGTVTPASGSSRDVSPIATTNYTMTVTNGAVSNTCSALVTVNNPPPPIAPTLTISTNTWCSGTDCSGPQGTVFSFHGSGFTPGPVHRHMRQDGGSPIELMPLLSADASGNFDWTYSSSCATPVATFTIVATDGSTEQPSNSVTETVTSASYCVTLYPGFGTAFINGVLGAGEWDNAATYAFNVNLSSGGTAPATLLVMNDGTNLYLGVKVVRSALDYGSGLNYEFDNNLDGFWPENGGDAWVFNVLNFGITDDFRTNAPPCSPNSIPGACGFRDVDYGGSNNGQAAVTNNGSFSFYELSHPLNSGDGHDVVMTPGGIGRFFLQFIMCGGTLGCVDTFSPGPRPFGFFTIVITP